MSSLNKVMLIGNVGQDPEIRSLQSGSEVANLSIATSESWKDKSTGEKKEKTEWHRVVVFNEGLVKVVKNYVKKGTKLYVEGALQTRKWTDNSGQEKYSTEVVLQKYNGQITLLSGKQQSEDSYTQTETPSTGALTTEELLSETQKVFPGAALKDDEIPF